MFFFHPKKARNMGIGLEYITNEMILASGFTTTELRNALEAGLDNLESILKSQDMGEVVSWTGGQPSFDLFFSPRVETSPGLRKYRSPFSYGPWRNHLCHAPWLSMVWGLLQLGEGCLRKRGVWLQWWASTAHSYTAHSTSEFGWWISPVQTLAGFVHTQPVGKVVFAQKNVF